jgi:hypothetical protein
MNDMQRGLKEAMRQRTILLVERLRRNIQFLEAGQRDSEGLVSYLPSAVLESEQKAIRATDAKKVGRSSY